MHSSSPAPTDPQAFFMADEPTLGLRGEGHLAIDPPKPLSAYLRMPKRMKEGDEDVLDSFKLQEEDQALVHLENKATKMAANPHQILLLGDFLGRVESSDFLKEAHIRSRQGAIHCLLNLASFPQSRAVLLLKKDFISTVFHLIKSSEKEITKRNNAIQHNREMSPADKKHERSVICSLEEIKKIALATLHLLAGLVLLEDLEANRFIPSDFESTSLPALQRAIEAESSRPIIKYQAACLAMGFYDLQAPGVYDLKSERVSLGTHVDGSQVEAINSGLKVKIVSSFLPLKRTDLEEEKRQACFFSLLEIAGSREGQRLLLKPQCMFAMVNLLNSPLLANQKGALVLLSTLARSSKEAAYLISKFSGTRLALFNPPIIVIECNI